MLRKGFVTLGLVVAALAALLAVVPGGEGVRVVASGEGDVLVGAPESVTATTTTDAPVSMAVPVAVETTTASVTGEPSTTTTTTTTTTDAPVTTTPDRGCQEDQECWNSCLMGVDGRFDPSDPRYSVPGPCNVFAVLPYGRRFEVHVVPTRDICGLPSGWVSRWALVTVDVVESDGAVVYRAVGSGCVDADAPVSGSGWVGELFRVAGSHA